MRKRCRLRLVCLLDLGSSPTLLSTQLLAAQSILVQPHQKHNLVSYVSSNYLLLECAFGGAGRYCPGVLNFFLLASYNNKLQCSRIFISCQLGYHGIFPKHVANSNDCCPKALDLCSIVNSHLQPISNLRS